MAAKNNSRRIPLNTLAEAIIDAGDVGDAKAAEKHGISRHTIMLRRKNLEKDPDLSFAISKRKRVQDDLWAKKIPVCLATILDTINAMVANSDLANNFDAKNLDTLLNAAEILSDVYMTRDIIEKRANGGNI